jgi:glycosyltransferase involved in cell wall biosynthesis
MNSDLVSVVIPAFNAEATIDDTLKSVRSQTHRTLEIILVDDGSTDKTMSIAAAHAAKDNRIVLISQENAGVAAARNVGWQLAHSELIAFVDADDLWAPTKIERQLEVMMEGGERVGLVYTWFDVIDEKNSIRFSGRGRNISGNVLGEVLGGNFVGNGSSPLVRRKALLEVGGYDQGLLEHGVHGCEDMLIYYRIARYFDFGLVPEHLTGYRVVSQRMSSNRPRMFASFRTVAREMDAAYPHRRATIEWGIRYYLRFLIGEALTFQDFAQVWPLLSPWVREHPLDLITIPLHVFITKVAFHLRWMIRPLFGRPVAVTAKTYPIGEPEP